MSASIYMVVIPLLVGLSFAGLAFVAIRAMYAGAESYSGEYSELTAREFEDIFLFIPPRRIAEIGWAGAAASFTLVFFLTASVHSLRATLAGMLLGLATAVLALQLPRQVVRLLRRRRLRRFNLQLVDTLVSMSNAMKAGFSITQAFESVVRDGENPIAQEFGLFLQQTRIGVSFSDALGNLDERVGSEDLTLVIMAIETARKTGGNLTEMFERISSTIRERMRIERRIRTLTAQQRLQGLIVGAMPVIVGVALMIVDPQMMLPFLRSLVGIGVVALVALLVAAGALVIRKIINIDV